MAMITQSQLPWQERNSRSIWKNYFPPTIKMKLYQHDIPLQIIFNEVLKRILCPPSQTYKIYIEEKRAKK